MWLNVIKSKVGFGVYININVELNIRNCFIRLISWGGFELESVVVKWMEFNFVGILFYMKRLFRWFLILSEVIVFVLLEWRYSVN